MPNKLMCKVKPAEREKYKELMAVAEPLLLKIQELIDADIEELEDTDNDDFSNPSWALEMAYKRGIKKGLTSLKKYVIMGTVNKQTKG